ncbi:unnamed protein product [Prunus armeniaca]|uniref:Uncharacterized protein n=1 Tax=Prunus armeniaca TaxID=36596 RepID=A0A6J5WNR1_PRUAR|nr:unnamed protein product [Prunus armeniaca]
MLTTLVGLSVSVNNVSSHRASNSTRYTQPLAVATPIRRSHSPSPLRSFSRGRRLSLNFRDAESKQPSKKFRGVHNCIKGVKVVATVGGGTSSKAPVRRPAGPIWRIHVPAGGRDRMVSTIYAKLFQIPKGAKVVSHP